MAAESRPDASIEALVSEVNGASVELVERVLEEYGDPANGSQGEETADQEETTDQSTMQGIKTNGSSTETDLTHDHETVDLTDKQRNALRLIRDHPHASQRDLADRLGISQSSINSRLNSIEGFEWEHRRTIARSLLETDSTSPDEPVLPTAPTGAEPSSSPPEDLVDEIGALAERITALEQQLESGTETAEDSFDDPALISKVVRACVNADDITSEEEQRIVARLVATERA